MELQGDLESRSAASLAGQLIGDLHFTRQGAPVLIVGHHILWGKVAALEKPLLVMRKRENVTPTGECGNYWLAVSPTVLEALPAVFRMMLRNVIADS